MSTVGSVDGGSAEVVGDGDQELYDVGQLYADALYGNNQQQQQFMKDHVGERLIAQRLLDFSIGPATEGWWPVYATQVSIGEWLYHNREHNDALIQELVYESSVRYLQGGRFYKSSVYADLKLLACVKQLDSIDGTPFVLAVLEQRSDYSMRNLRSLSDAIIDPLIELTPDEDRVQLLGLACERRFPLVVKLAILSFDHEPAPISRRDYQQLLHEIKGCPDLTSKQRTHYQELVKSKVQVRQIRFPHPYQFA